jgi:hypothetical protein
MIGIIKISNWIGKHRKDRPMRDPSLLPLSEPVYLKGPGNSKNDVTTFSITTFSITSFSIMTFNITTFSTTTQHNNE